MVALVIRVGRQLSAQSRPLPENPRFRRSDGNPRHNQPRQSSNKCSQEIMPTRNHSTLRPLRHSRAALPQTAGQPCQPRPTCRQRQAQPAWRFSNIARYPRLVLYPRLCLLRSSAAWLVQSDRALEAELKSRVCAHGAGVRVVERRSVCSGHARGPFTCPKSPQTGPIPDHPVFPTPGRAHDGWGAARSTRATYATRCRHLLRALDFQHDSP